jgi:hypothetical protein
MGMRQGRARSGRREVFPFPASPLSAGFERFCHFQQLADAVPVPSRGWGF